MTNFIIGILSSLVATAIVSLFVKNSKSTHTDSNHRWFWRLLLFIGKPLFIIGVFIIGMNLAVATLGPVNTYNVGMGGLITFLGGLFWTLGFIFT